MPPARPARGALRTKHHSRWPLRRPTRIPEPVRATHRPGTAGTVPSRSVRFWATAPIMTSVDGREGEPHILRVRPLAGPSRRRPRRSPDAAWRSRRALVGVALATPLPGWSAYLRLDRDEPGDQYRERLGQVPVSPSE